VFCVDPDPYVFEPRGYRFGSFHHQVKKYEKSWFLLFCDFFMNFFLFLKNDENVPSKSKNKNKNIFVDILKATDEKSRIRSRLRIRIRNSLVRIRGSDPYQNDTGPQHWLAGSGAALSKNALSEALICGCAFFYILDSSAQTRKWENGPR
jgi:hypothetical protein